MPISVDHSKPVRTVDTSGKVVSTNTNNAAPMKTVDSVGRAVKAESQQVAEKAAETLPNFATGQTSGEPSKPTENQGQGETQSQDAEKLTEAKLRKEYLEAQKLKRQAQELEKKNKARLDRAEAFDKAREMAENGQDPTAILKAAGLDPVKFYRQMTDYALSDKGKAEAVDPVQKELADHRARLDAYAKELEERNKQAQEREEIAAHNQVIQEAVIPLIKNNPDRYEVLITHYGNQAAVEVYKNVWEIYQQTGVARKFEEVADEMEKYWSEQVEAGLNNALKMNRFKNRFTQSDSQTSRNTTSERQDTPSSSITLSNKQQIASTPTTGNPYKGLTKEERVAAILKKFDS